MDLNLAGRRALITGGSRGIGLACAEVLAEEGVHVAIAGREVAQLKEVTKRLRSGYDVEITSHSCDLTRSEHQQALVDVVGPIDILVNNAGAIPPGDIDSIDEQAWRTAWDLKVMGYVNLCRMVLPRMMERSAGVIVNVIGTASRRPRPDYVAGAAGNAALVGLTAALGSRSLTDGVRVVGVNPGLTLTDRLETMLRKTATERWGNEERWEDLIPSGPGPAAPGQIADVVAFLASDRASHISGTTVDVDGGAANR